MSTKFPFLRRQGPHRSARGGSSPRCRPTSFCEVFDYAVKSMGFTILCTITGLDQGATLGVIYHLARPSGVMLNLATSVPKDKPVLQTVTRVLPRRRRLRARAGRPAGLPGRGPAAGQSLSAAGRLAGGPVPAPQGLEGRNARHRRRRDGGGRPMHECENVQIPDRPAAPGPEGAESFMLTLSGEKIIEDRRAAGLQPPRHREGLRGADLHPGHLPDRADLRHLLALALDLLRPGGRGDRRPGSPAARALHPHAHRRAGARPQPPAVAGRGRARGRLRHAADVHLARPRGRDGPAGRC